MAANPEQEGTTSGQTETRSAEATTSIAASTERVWRALTEARELERWFPLEARVDPGVNGTIWMSWRNEFSGEMKILEWNPPRHLRTAWSFHETDSPAQVTDYSLEARGGQTVLRVVTSGFPVDASWDGWVEGTARGWAFELRSLKHYLERHEGEERHVAYVRRRVPVATREAWLRLRASGEIGPWFSTGEAFDERPGGQYAAVLPGSGDELFRISIEPGAPGADLNEVVIFLSAWGERAEQVAELRSRFAGMLERAFPEGSTP